MAEKQERKNLVCMNIRIESIDVNLTKLFSLLGLLRCSQLNAECHTTFIHVVTANTSLAKITISSMNSNRPYAANVCVATLRFSKLKNEGVFMS